MSTDSAPTPDPASESSPPPDLRELIRQMTEAGAWPEPDLFDRIVAAGEEAVEPLREVIRTRPRGWPDEAPVYFASGLLGEIGASAALLDLVAVARDYLNETSEEAASAISRLGADGFEALFGLIQEPGVSGYQRCHLIEAAKNAVDGDSERRERLAAVLRGLFEQAQARASEAEAFEDELLAEPAGDDVSDEEELGEVVDSDADEEFDQDEELENEDEDEIDLDENLEPIPLSSDDSDSFEKEQAENEVLPDEDLAFLASDLADLGDPLARDLVLRAFDEDAIEEAIIDRETFLEFHAKGPDVREPTSNWLEEYRQSYREQKDYEERMIQLGDTTFPTRASYPSLEREERAQAPPAPVEPFRHIGPKISRNDPCWCGSGKKYKKCHWGKDDRA